LYGFSGAVPVGYRIEADGRLTPLSLQTRIDAIPSVHTPDGRFGFTLRTGQIVTLRIHANGSIQEAFATNLPRSVSVVSLAVNGSGTLLFIAGSEDVTFPSTSTIWTYQIAASGKLELLNSLEFDRVITQLVAPPNGPHLYALSFEQFGFEGALDLFAVSDTGSVSLVSSMNPGLLDIQNLLIRPDGRFLYMGLNPPQIVTFARDLATGALTVVPPIVGCNCDGGPDFGGPIAINATGTLLFETTGQDGGVAIYTLPSSGVPVPHGESFILTESTHPDMATDGTGRFLFVVNFEAFTTTTYSVSDAGAATITGTPIPALGVATVIARRR
jgi:hypothetical protein